MPRDTQPLFYAFSSWTWKALPRAPPTRIPRDQDWPRRDFLAAGPQTLPSPASVFKGEAGALETLAPLLAENSVKVGGEAVGVFTFKSLS